MKQKVISVVPKEVKPDDDNPFAPDPYSFNDCRNQVLEAINKL